MTITADLLPWQEMDWQHLVRYITGQRIPQAVLFAGNKGIGKSRLAERFAHSLLCSQTDANGLPCGQCHGCQLVIAQTHPDHIRLNPEEPGKAIKVDQIRHILSVLSLKPQYEANRVVIVEPADQLNISAVNAFLKFLEEPSERTVLLLITDKPSRLPATLMSRCQKVYFSRPDPERVKQWLLDQGIKNNGELLLSVSKGSPLLALDYANNNTLELRRKCFDQWLDIAALRTHPYIVSEQWVKLDPGLLLTWITGWVADLIKCCFHLPAERLINRDLFEDLFKSAQNLELSRLYSVYDLMLTSRNRIDTQLNKQLLFEELLIEWVRLNEK
ncbi:MAG TPA: DNA polymerase III subunit delta' [Methylococcaceae bacterium]|nr:DNA polymerase III subunit delta' [Methylococcaceae bacterium]